MDLPVDALPGATLFDLGGSQDELHAVQGTRVEVQALGDLPERIRAQALREAGHCDNRTAIAFS